MNRRETKRLHKALLLPLLALLLVMFSGASIVLASPADKTITGLGTGAIANPIPGNGGWSYVYYGKYHGSPVKYRVLDKASTDFGGNTMLLDCDSTLFLATPDINSNLTAPYVWGTSSLRQELNGGAFYTQWGVFTDLERSAIAKSKKPQVSENDGYGSAFGVYAPLDGERIFLLDSVEATRASYGYQKNDIDNSTRKKSGASDGWWLRSPDGSYKYLVNRASASGYISSVPSHNYDDDGGVSPAFNVNLSSVLFTSIIPSEDRSYKLTLKDGNLSFTSIGNITRSGKTITVQYLIPGNVNRISVLMTDREYTESGAIVRYYGIFSDEKNFTLPDGYEDNWKTYIVPEQVNGEKETDYAGTPVAISIPKAPVASGSETPAKDSGSETSTKVTIPAKGTVLIEPKGTAIYKVASNNASSPSVIYTEPRGKKTSVTIPATITISGVTYKVTSIASNAFKGNKKLKKITIGANVEEIGKKAFASCTKLTTVNCKSKVLKKIGVSAFQGDKKLKTITLKTTLLKSSKVGKNAFKGTASKLTIKVPKKAKKAYQKFFKKKGNKKVKIK